jgi:hypothetical protein
METQQNMEQIIAMLTRMQKRMINREDFKEMTARMDANRKTDKEKMNANIKTMLAEILEKADASHKEAEAMRNVIKTNQAELKSAIAQIEWKKLASVEMKPEAAHEGVTVEDAARMPVGEPTKRRRDRNLAAQRRQKKEQNRTQKKDGCLKNLVAAHRGTTRRWQVAPRRTLLTTETRGNCGSHKRVIVVYRKISRHATVAFRKRLIRSTVEGATQRVGRLRKNLQSRQESGKATKYLGGKRPLHPEKRKTTGIDIGGWSSGELSPLRRR